MANNGTDRTSKRKEWLEKRVGEVEGSGRKRREL